MIQKAPHSLPKISNICQLVPKLVFSYPFFFKAVDNVEDTLIHETIFEQLKKIS